MGDNAPLHRGDRVSANPLEERVHALLAQGKPSAAADIAVRELGPDVRRFIRAALHDEALAADAFSAFTEDVVRALPGFRGDAALRTWAYRLAWHALRRVRDDAWQRRRCTLDLGAVSPLAKTESDTPLVRERRALALEKMRLALSLEEQTLLALRIDQGLCWAEISRILSHDGITVGADALMKRFERLKTRLAEVAKREGLLSR